MQISRRTFLRSAAAGTVVGVAGGVGGWRLGQRSPAVGRYEIGLDRLPEGFDGFRIAVVSDLHAGAHMDEARMAGVARLVDGLGADLVVVAGDMADGRASEADARAFARVFGALRPPAGIVAVPGNHDHYAGVDTVRGALEGTVINLLEGGHHVIDRPRGGLVVLGIDDPVTASAFDPPQDDAVAAVRERAPADRLPILVAHRPAAFDAAKRFGIPLTLAGHTHGGQIGLPARDLTPVRLVTKYIRGHYEGDGCHLVVSSGVGTGGMPLRLGVPPSVELVTLRPGRSGLRITAEARPRPSSAEPRAAHRGG